MSGSFLRLLNQRIELIKRRILNGFKQDILVVCYNQKLCAFPKTEFPADGYRKDNESQADKQPNNGSHAKNCFFVNRWTYASGYIYAKIPHLPSFYKYLYPVMLILPVLGQTHPFIAIGGIVRS